MKRAVVSVRNVVSKNARGTGGSNLLTLECGHVVRRKGSIAIPRRANCRECDDVSVPEARVCEYCGACWSGENECVRCPHSVFEFDE